MITRLRTGTLPGQGSNLNIRKPGSHCSELPVVLQQHDLRHLSRTLAHPACSEDEARPYGMDRDIIDGITVALCALHSREFS